MSIFYFLIFIVIVLIIYFIFRKNYKKEAAVNKRKRKREKRVANYISEAFKIENLEDVKESKTTIALVYPKETLDVEPEQVVKVENQSEEKVVTEFEMPEGIKREELYDFSLKHTKFYIAHDRYARLKTVDENEQTNSGIIK
ncbi:hypothetical protein ABLV91_11575 [Staphylococcus equorum]|uniref:Uncharacterized protein n=1 Tax=Staphylococcus equorum TaxID=246432 RepID=A0AAP7LUT4_9STAP|nr:MULTISPECIES: hypothetical protein [Staphylococcus]ANK38810.1 hypothetical protein AOB58_2008 [Staphylococcus sp. AntiMn-1]ANR69188.1 hypothetical protein AWC34_11660 [Staphylococcus equorum]EJX18336.1 hypothetical protein SOJ_05140 [Staphylococcus sp. OJ82]ERH35675.1 hypothetical protein SEQU_03970 [Staphylococcus equorum UMC-CNS-924]KKI53562.1 hypothetical protein UF72_2423 [Staphylococcus equorum subsp. equorum]